MAEAVTVKERPLMFTTESVRGILAGRKSQTRRVVKPQPPPECSIHYMLGNESWMPEEKRSRLAHHWEAWGGELFRNRPNTHLCGSHSVVCPYGKPGERIWAKETFWCKNETCDHDYCGGCDLGSNLHLGKEYAGVQYVATPECCKLPERVGKQTIAIGHSIHAHAPGGWWLAPPNDWDGKSNYTHRGVWEFLVDVPYTRHAAMFMPRWASRILLEITDVRVERVQDITEADSIAEGICTEYLPPDPDNFHPPGSYGYISGIHPVGTGPIWPKAAQAYQELWDSINVKKHPWSSNPWVWVISFKRIV